MIIQDINKLKDQIGTKAFVNCEISNDDLGPDDYPMVQIIPNQSFSIYKRNNGHTFDFPVTLKIIVSRKNEPDALDVLERVLCALDEYGRCSGSELTEDGGTAEYTANEYILSLVYNLKLRQIGE